MSKSFIVGVLLTLALAKEYLGITNHEGSLFIPLKSIDYSIKVVDGLMSFCIRQVYKNDYSHAIDAVYVFPINYHMATTNVTIHYSSDDSILVGELEEKNTARNMYERARDRGQGAAFVRFDGEQRDMLSLDLGNILSNETLVVKLNFVEQLRVEDASWAIRIPTTFIPPYQTGGLSSRSSEASITSDDAYSMTLNLEIDSSSEITRLMSPSHDITTTFSPDYKKAQAHLKNQYDSPDRGIVILYRNLEIDQPRLIVQKSPLHDTYAILISYLPFSNTLPRSRLDTDRNRKYYEPERYLKAKSEFIFLIDCSGSMQGRIYQAREAAKLFIKSLPHDSYFSFVFFGSTYVVAPPGKSVKYTSETVEQAWKYLSKMDADMGGTELDSAMRYVLRMPRIEGYMRNILVMTDGEVSMPEQTISIVRMNAKDAYVNTIGIGAGASRHLVQGLAEAGRGTSYFITEGEAIMPKVIEALNNMCVDKVQDVKIQWPTKPQLSYEPKIGFYGQSLVATAIFKEKPSGKVTITGYRSNDRKYFENTFDLNSIKLKEGVDVYQLAVKLAFDEKLVKGTEEMCNLSKKYSVLSEETAFVGKKVYANGTNRKNVKEVQVPIMKTRESSRYGAKNIVYDYKLMPAAIDEADVKAIPCSSDIDKAPNRNVRYEDKSMRNERLRLHSTGGVYVEEAYDDSMEMIRYQKVSGSFELDQRFIKEHLGKSIEDIKQELAKYSVLLTDEEVLITVIMLLIFDKKYLNEPKMQLIRIKAINWLKTKGIDYNAMRDELNIITNIKTDL